MGTCSRARADYVMHKLIVGLLSTYELLGSARALRVAERLARHIRTRVDRLIRRGLTVWFDFINQEVGGMSEALADLGRLTGNSSWLQLAAMFERPCFVGALARGGAADAIERVHANTHLPQLLGAMARYENTGEEALRAAAENFWSELAAQHLFVTGSSTTGEVWLRAGELGNAVAPQGRNNYWAHDQAETCVAHNSMRISRRLLQWSRWAAWDRPIAHASYYERTLYNAVLGTQRGTHPGQMLYMMPLGAGVSKAGIPDAPQGHHWSDDEHHFWWARALPPALCARRAHASPRSFQPPTPSPLAALAHFPAHAAASRSMVCVASPAGAARAVALRPLPASPTPSSGDATPPLPPATRPPMQAVRSTSC